MLSGCHNTILVQVSVAVGLALKSLQNAFETRMHLLLFQHQIYQVYKCGLAIRQAKQVQRLLQEVEENLVS